MVVKKVAMLSASSAAEKRRNKKYKLTVAVEKLEGLLPQPPLTSWRRRPSEGAKTAEIRWQLSASRSGRGVLHGYLSGRKKPSYGVSLREAVSDRGVVRWDAADAANRFDRVCCLGDVVSVAASHRSSCLDLSFSILYGSSSDEGEVNKLEEIGSTIVRVPDLFKDSQHQNRSQGLEVKEMKKKLHIETKIDGLSSYSVLHITVSLVEETASKRSKEASTIESDLIKDAGSQQQINKYYFDGSLRENLPMRRLLQMDKNDNLVKCTTENSTGAGTSSSDEISSPEPGSSSKHHFRFWTKRSKVSSIANDFKEETSRVSTPNEEHPGSDHDNGQTGSWSEREFISRDKKAKLRVHTFFASIDQRDPSAGGESACTVIVAVIADALHSGGLDAPTRSQFDSLIKEGSKEWQELCCGTSYIERFPDKHFDIETVLEAKVRPISIVQDKSFIGFFQPENFRSLQGAMSFDDIWLQITNNMGRDPQVYIVSWNDHFFILRLQDSAYYVMDTLGERLYEGCNKAYMLRFDDTTEMYNYQVEGGDEEKEELICRGKGCCKEYIKRFLAAITLEEELELEKKETGSNSALHQRLQIEFQLTEASDSTWTASSEFATHSNWSSSNSWINSSWTDTDWKKTMRR